MTTKVGELFMLGFRGTEIPAWVKEFESRFGLGGVILFDYDVQTKTYRNNILSREQLAGLVAAIGDLPSRPLVFVDQEGGKVRRLKESLGFAPLPSHAAMATLSDREKSGILRTAFTELKNLGIHFNLAPVIDLNTNPQNPDIGAIGRSFSVDPSLVRKNTQIFAKVAGEVGLGLCLKHYPGLGGATTNSHHSLTDLTGTVSDEQLALFEELAPQIPGDAILVSHGIHNDWDRETPLSMSATVLGKLREKLPDTLLVSDDIQMQGLQMRYPSRDAVVKGIRAGLDLLILGNNLLDESAQCLEYAEHLQNELRNDEAARQRAERSMARVARRKARFAKG